MKSIVFLGAFALLIILTLADVPQESSQDVAEASEFGLLERETREAGRKRKKGQKGKGKGKKGRGRKRAKGRKSKGNGKGKGKGNGKGKGKGRKVKGKGKGTNKKPINSQRQSTTDVPADDVSKVFSEYKKGVNRLRQVKRINKWISQMAKKEEKSPEAFTEAAKALDKATNNGADCNGATSNSSIKAKVLELNNCSVSAKAHCAFPNKQITNEAFPTNDANSCPGILELSVTSTSDWLQNPSIATITDVIYPDPTCVDFAKTWEPLVKDMKNNCVGTTATGSFGQCSNLLKEAAGLILSCGKIEPNGPPTTTSAPSGRHRIFKFQQQIF